MDQVQDHLLSRPEVERIACVSTSLLYDLIAKGKFPKPLKIGSKSVWPASEVHGWVESLKEGRQDVV